MRISLLAIAIVALAPACKSGDKKPAATETGATGGSSGSSGGAGGATPAGYSVKGTLTIAGALNDTFTWNPELAVDYCACDVDQKLFTLDATMKNAKGDVFISFRFDSKGEVSLGSAAMKSGRLNGTTGVTMSNCTMRNFAPGTFAVDVDTTVSSGAEQATIKGHLDAACN